MGTLAPVAGHERERAAARPNRGTPAAEPAGWVATRPATGRALATAAPLLLLVGAWAGNPVLVLLALGTATTAALARRLTADLAVVAAGLLLLLCAVASGTLAAWVGVDLLAAPGALVACYAAGAVAVAATWWTRPGATAGAAPDRTSLVGLLPALAAGVTALLQSAKVEAAQAWAFQGTDFVSHMSLLLQVQRDGNLDYALTGYPRGLHMLAALVSVPGAPLEDSAAMLDYDLRLVGGLTWLSLAFVIWTGSVLVLRMGRAVGLGTRVATASALVLGTLMLLTDTFLDSFVGQAAAPSLVAVAVLYGLVLGLVVRPRALATGPALLASAAMATALVAHLWQALVVVPGAAVLVVSAAAARHGPRAWLAGWSGRRSVAAAPVAAAGLVLTLAPLTRIVDAGGSSLAAQEGNLGGDPWRLLVPAVLAAVVMLRRPAQPWAQAVIGGGAGLVLMTAVLLHGAGNGLDLRQWYPLKACWFLTLFLAPVLALAVTRLAARSLCPVWCRLHRTGFVARSTAVAVVATLAAVTWLPWQLGASPALEGAWHPYHHPASSHALAPLHFGGAYDLAREHGTRYLPAVVVAYRVEENAIFENFSARLVSDLVSFQTGQPSLAGTSGVCSAIRRAAGSGPAVVLTRALALDVRHDMAREGCPGRARVVSFAAPA